MKNRKYIPSIILSFVVILLMSCEETTESDPITGTISGTITFSNVLPLSAEIIAALFKDWPPVDPSVPPMSDYVYITNDSLNSAHEYIYTFEDVAFDTYDLIGVSYTDIMNSDVTTNKIFLGAHHGTWPMYMDADTIAISVANYDVAYDFTANVSFAYDCVSFFTEDSCGPVEGCIWMGGEHEHCMGSVMSKSK